MKFAHLLSGFDTIECAYYLRIEGNADFIFSLLAVEKECLQQAKSKASKVIKLGAEEFLLSPRGTGSGFPFLLENELFRIQCGELNKPNFFVTFSSYALWHHGARALHQRFLEWAQSVGYIPYRPESLSRVDLTFDYQIDEIDFDEDSFVTQASNDSKYRKDRRAQTFYLGSGNIVLRIYNKSDEIAEQSNKTWFFPIWGTDHGVWRIEWQTRKPILKRFGIRTFDDLSERQGDILRYLVNEHTKLAISSADTNRSRWNIHPLWVDLQDRIEKIEGLGVYRECDPQARLEEREMRVAISLYGYAKRLGAIHCLQRGYHEIGLDQVTERMAILMHHVHDEFAWKVDIQRRIDEMRVGKV